ncbi:hypothetical protein DPEC_G00183370 [Dallia pectoralis]|uniref:Uncharacterized protein n=1 Tax=Dallia pectoralis TaxID=75939 RepID=A0ACC2GAQ7_DALPE|nr:hypothetical protein DPEC_G00183370 [Dallia pectoralis]
MSTRRTLLLVENQPTTRSGERTPLRNVQNEMMMHCLTPSSRRKARSMSGSNVLKTQKNEIAFIYPDQLPCGNLPAGDVGTSGASKHGGEALIVQEAVDTGSGLEDITLKSFLCAGGEVEVSDPSGDIDETIVLLKDQPYRFPAGCNIDNTSLSDSMVTQCCNDHKDHAYCDFQDILDPTEAHLSFTGVLNSSIDGVPQSTHKAHTTDGDVTSQRGDLTFKSSFCNEVEVPEASRVEHETVLLPMDQSVNHCLMYNYQESPSIIVDRRDVPPSDYRAEQPYCNTANGTASAEANIPSVMEPLNSSLLTGALIPGDVNHTSVHVDDFVLDADEDSVLQNAADGSYLFQANPDSGVWGGGLDSPLALPKFNSTTLGAASAGKIDFSPAPVREDVEGRLEVAVPQSKPKAEFGPMGIFGHLPGFVPEGPLQQQLCHMAQLLMLASGKMVAASDPAPTLGPAPSPCPTLTSAGQTAGTAATVCHNMCVGTTPVRLVDHSANTTGVFERKREFAVSDASTSTDSLVWSLAPGSLTSVSKQELEQRLTSTLIMLEALVQQQSTARGRNTPTPPGPSELRDKLVQTDHTELSQTVTYKNLYVTALQRVEGLEVDRTTLQNLLHHVQDARTTVAALTGDTAAALSNMRQIGDLVMEDRQLLATQYGQMRSLYEKCTETQGRMTQKVRAVLQQREDMRGLMEGALSAKQAAFNVTEQLRAHSARRLSELEESVGSYQELKDALAKTYPEQVQLNKAYVESLNSASELLRGTMNDHAGLQDQLVTARCLLQRTMPLLVKLNEKAASAVAERDQALSDRDQMQEELSGVQLNLQDARQEIGDLNLQATIMNSELGVLRQKLSEGEEEQADLQRKVTELSTTVSSTLDSYAFLEQALAAESSKLQQSWTEVKQTKDRANELEGSLGQSEQRVGELTRALAQTEEELERLQNLTQSQGQKLQEFQEVRSQLHSLKEMNEFLQMENETAREQVFESEGTLWANLQGLRERNIQCEDLRAALSQLQAEKETLQVELQCSCTRARSVELELGEQLAQAVNKVTILHHTLRTLTNDILGSLTTTETVLPPSHHMERNPSTSFVDRVIVAITADQAEAGDAQPPSKTTQDPSTKGLGSSASAFAPVTPRKCPVESPEEKQSSVVDLLADLGNMVSELRSGVTQLQHSRDAEREDLTNTICSLQEAQQSQAERHEAELSELRAQLSFLQTRLEREQQTLQNKAQEVETMKKICSEVADAREFIFKHKSENSELRKEVAELRRLLHQSQVESQALREELRNLGNLSAHSMHSMDDKIRLLKEVERLKRSMSEAEEGRAKILDRARRHQAIHETNQLKLERELKVLDDMIETVRKTLSSIPIVVKNCKELQTLVEYLG